MTTFVLVCGIGSTPPELSALPSSQVGEIPTQTQIDASLDGCRRLVVVGQDAALAAALTRLMRTERLDVELAYVSAEKSPATRAYRLPTGSRAARRALDGAATALPLMRDDLGAALIGSATLTGPGGAELTGETYVDDHVLFSGNCRGVEIRPTPQEPGLRAARLGGLRRRWFSGRAAQTGAVAAHLVRDGVSETRELTRSTFYRHVQDWLLVR
ncbi:hypothetical protein G4X40_07965 [Rhodococcus sp. D2-41]|uniref:Peptidase M50 n=1 Tax=Speluncibacter jeojiensis TaxID=2710754 RepID=A0A9X4M094_9ACTN|nr:hypothetical protein [Rhodococcus sp. D2-41]MDG3010084.1 hypothetical protein [Rhodococcus sp. D2-41]MDG3015630.1 hypothetical protein [Corynebacteriales bacterium D3-21]